MDQRRNHKKKLGNTEMNENKTTMQQKKTTMHYSLWDAAAAAPRGKFIAVNVSIKKDLKPIVYASTLRN